MKKKTTITKKDERRNKMQRTEPEKAHPTGEFVIMARFGGHVLHHLGLRGGRLKS